MPLSNYDQEFGGKAGAATKAYKNMMKEYPDPKKAKSIFYATKNKRKKQMGLVDTVSKLKSNGSLK